MRPSTRLAGVVAVVVAAVLSGPAGPRRLARPARSRHTDPGQARGLCPDKRSQRQFHRGVPAGCRWDAGTRRQLQDGRQWRESKRTAPSDPLTGATYDVDGGQQFTA